MMHTNREKTVQQLESEVREAWQAYERTPDCLEVPTTWAVFDAYRALADQLEQATGFAVTCGELTGRPA